MRRLASLCLLMAALTWTVPGMGQAANAALVNAIILEQATVVRTLLRTKPDLAARTEEGRSLPTLAVESGNLDIIKALLDAGADFSAVDGRGNTPALLATQGFGGNPQAIIALLGQNRVDLDQSTEYFTPLYYAVMNRDTALVQALLAAGAKPSAATAEGRLPIVEAVGDAATLGLLLAAGADPDSIDRHGDPVLFTAVRDDAMDALQLLLEAGANANQTNGNGEAAISFARFNRNDRAIDLLVEHGATNPAAAQAAAAQAPAFTGTVADLPYYAGADTFMVQGATAIYVSGDSVPVVADSTFALLQAAGWTGEVRAQDDKHRNLRFTRAGAELTAHIAVAPAQGGKTMIQYNLIK